MDRSKSRHFSEKEIGALVQRATELHEQAKGESDRSLSLDDIEQIAAELGVPSEFLRAAAAEIENDRNSTNPFSILGGPFVIRRSLVVDETMTDDQWGDIVLKLRNSLGGPGQITTVGKNNEWFHSLGEGDGAINLTKTRVSVSVGDEETLVRLEKNFGVGAVMAYLAAVVPVVVLTGVMLTDAGANLIAGTGLILSILAAVRAMIFLWTSRETARVQEVAEVIHDTIATTAISDSTGQLSNDLIDVPDIEPVDDSSQSKNSGSRRHRS
ncbi:MAG TPA: hypothetical protein VKP65_18555 [Rhodothermales bacterium]|nr:hypothetical protein [Rhodothermales bacterium]